MALPVPNLDDRRFQDLVDDAKRLVQQRCPEWTDHNVSDPGVTLIETFAWMTDQLLYRLNRVPDRHYVKFLELIGVQPLPADGGARRGDVLALRPAAGHRADRRRDPGGDRPHRDRRGGRLHDPRRPADRAGHARPRRLDLHRRQDARDRSGEASRTAATSPASTRSAEARRRAATSACPRRCRRTRCACASRCRIEGVGVDPTPPLAWEAWTGDDWEPRASSTRDATGGLNRDGDVVLHVPAATRSRSSRSSGPAGSGPASRTPRRASRSTAPSPSITRASPRSPSAAPPTRSTPSVVVDEIVGTSEGVAGQRFLLKRGRSCPGDRPHGRPRSPTTRTAGRSGPRSRDFAASGPDDRHFVLDAVAGEIRFGPAVREPDGAVRALRRGAAEGRAGSSSTST